MLSPLCGESQFSGSSPYKQPVMQTFDMFIVSPNNLLNEQLSCQLFKLSWPWYDITVMIQGDGG